MKTKRKKNFFGIGLLRNRKRLISALTLHGEIVSSNTLVG